MRRVPVKLWITSSDTTGPSNGVPTRATPHEYMDPNLGTVHPDRPSNPLRVMVVDDDPTTLELVRVLLEDIGCMVVTRMQAIGTAAQLQEVDPDFVLLDIHMPALRGDRVAEILSRGGRLKRARLIFHSARPPEELMELTETHGAAGWIHKDGDHAGFVRRFEEIVASVSQGNVNVQ